MRESLRLGRIAGVNVGINWSVLVIFLLITVGLAAGRFPELYPDESTAAYVAAGLGAGVIFLASLLAHEIAHAVVARRHGVEVEGITLWMFGGVARLRGEAPDPRAELQIAGVGPLVSLLLAGLFGLITLGLDLSGVEGIVLGAFGWLALINLVLAVFNLVPAGPLDGGRILRSILWWRSGDRYAASVTSARAGRGFGWFLVGLGVLQFVAGAGLAGLWMILIGWFLTTIARAEEEHAEVNHALSGVRVRDIMTADPVTVPSGTPVDRFVEDFVFPNRFSSFPVVDDGHPVGLVTLNRVKHLRPEDRPTTRVEDLGCSIDEVAVVPPDRAAADVLTEMSSCPDGRALVVDHGRLVGIVSPIDVMRQLELVRLRDRAGPAHH